MASNIPSIGLLQQQKDKDMKKCIICQKVRRSEQVKPCTTTVLNTIIEASDKLKDGLLDTCSELDDVKYHRQECFKAYVLKGKRVKEEMTNGKVINDEVTCSGDNTNDPIHNVKKRRMDQEEVCVICNKERCNGRERTLSILSDESRTKMFLAAIKYNGDDVYSRCAIYETPGNILSANLKSHERCMNRYLLQYRRQLDEMCENDAADSCYEVKKAFQMLVQDLKLDSRSYVISECRDFINSHLCNEMTIDNRALKNLLIEEFGDEIAFTHPRDKRKSQVFFATRIGTEHIVETLREDSTIKTCAKQLREECLHYSFGLDSSYCDASDVDISLKNLDNNKPKLWTDFFRVLFPGFDLSKNIQRKCFNIFQIVFYMLNSGECKTPMHVRLAQTIHDTSRSKELIETCNRMGLCMSYGELVKIDNSLARRTIALSGENHVPVPPSMKPSVLIHAAVDNFDHNENSSSGIGSSHDTVLILFQNPPNPEPEESTMSIKPKEEDTPIDCILDCQKLKSVGKISQRGEIGNSFHITSEPPMEEIKTKSDNDFLTWQVCMSETLDDSPDKPIPSFTAVNSVLITESPIITEVAFTPIIPQPATDYDTIYTSLKNYQDVLLQKNMPYGPLWCDEGVYRLAKELQLLRPDDLGNIFIGLGGFHMEKVVLSCIGKYLEASGIDSVLIEKNIYGPSVVASVMNGGHYVRSKRGMNLITVAMSHLFLKEFVSTFDDTDTKELIDHAHKLNEMLNKSTPNQVEIRKCWTMCRKSSTSFENALKEFKEKRKGMSDEMNYWLTFLDDIVPVLRDLTRSHREGNWQLHISAVRRAIALFFAFDRTNYSRWTPLYLDDCLALEKKFPLIHEDFKKGGFVSKHTRRCGSALPMDQALEKHYKKTAKGPGGIIGMTRRKEAVAKWNIIKQEKGQYTEGIRSHCHIKEDIDSEYAVHHDFANGAEDNADIQKIVDCVSQKRNPFRSTEPHPITNISTGKQLDTDKTSSILNCVESGEKAYAQYKSERLEEKSKKLFDPIPRCSKKATSPKSSTTYDLKKDTAAVLRHIDTSRLRGFSINELLRHELASTSWYLTNDGLLKKPDKSELSRELTKKLASTPTEVPVTENQPQAVVVIDFMSFARKVPTKKLQLVTFLDMYKHLLNTFTYLSERCSRVDIVFDLYVDDSVKHHERSRRQKCEGIPIDVSHLEQRLPVQMDGFWACDGNKVQFQQLFAEWISMSYKGSKNLYLGGGHRDDLYSCVLVNNGMLSVVHNLRSTQEEADDRLLLHINHAITSDQFSRVVVASSDTDVLVCLLYHFNKWRTVLSELWVICGASRNRKAVPVHTLAIQMGVEVCSVLPAAHALTGCDTTSKIGTKRSALIMAEKHHELLSDFGYGELNDEMFNMSEKYLIGCVSGPENSTNSFDGLRYHHYHHNTFDLQKLPASSSTIQLHIQRAYLQCHKWIYAPLPGPNLDPLDYGYERHDSGYLIPSIISESSIPNNFPYPCNCGKCAKSTCPCRTKKIKCCDLCKCSLMESCKNPANHDDSVSHNTI